VSWQDQSASRSRDLLKSVKQIHLDPPKAKDGTIICGAVSQSALYNKRLRQIDRKLLAIETESGGVFSAAKERSIPALAVRGISDAANADKKRLDVKTKGVVRRIAALNAATYLRLQIENPHILEILRTRKIRHTSGSSSGVIKSRKNQLGPLPSIVTAIAEVANDLQSRLREISPEYRLQERGYKLPAPRVRKLSFEHCLANSMPASPTEVREAMQNRHVTIIHLPRAYPDPSLPWVIADDLLTAQLDQRQPIPIVLDGNTMRPSNKTLHPFTPSIAESFRGNSDTVLVYVVNEIPFESRSRLAFIEQQIRSHGDCKFLLLTKDDLHVVTQSTFASSFGAEVYQIAGASFGSIAHFLQKNFSMSYSEAEVVALRLQTTFEEFRLSAHPTYFAGIQKKYCRHFFRPTGVQS
jgi:hypothetical protein